MARRTVALSLALAVAWVVPVAGTPDGGAPPPAVQRQLEVASWEVPTTAAERRPAAGALAAVAEHAEPGDHAGHDHDALTRHAEAAPDGWRVSAPVPAGDGVLVGADWGGDADTLVEVRTGDEAGWSDWMPLVVDDGEHQPDPASAEAAAAARSTASEPVYVGRVDDLQFRVQGGRPDLQVNLVDVAGDLSWTPGAAPGGSAAMAATDYPRIRPRASWGADESRRNGQVDYSDDIRFSVIHHEGGAPRWSQAAIADGCQQADDAIRAIYAYHTGYRGLWDIAYNFVVDPCGGIWEGRHGGVARPVMGAHAGGWNDGSFGVLALGTFTSGNSDPITDDMIEGIEDLVAWKLDIHHVDPRGTTREVSGGSTSRYAEGTPVDVPVLSAHTITNATSCPGDVLMGRLFDGAGSSARATAAYRDGVLRNGLPKAYDTTPDRWVAGQDGDTPTWDVDFSEEVDWSLRITDEDGDLVRATGGASEDHAEREWDLRDADGHVVESGVYTATVTASGADDVITPVVRELSVNAAVDRFAGVTRVETAVELSRWAFDEAETAVVASAGAYPDALVASPLAGSYDGPVLLTPTDALPDSVADEVDRLGATRVIVVGGARAVSDGVVEELGRRTGASVERIGGVDRFGTAAAVAGRIDDREEPTEVLLALGQHADETRSFPDALSAGAFGADQGLPVLLTRDTRLPEASADALEAIAPDDVTLFGGTQAIADAVVGRVRAATGGAFVARFAGVNRYDTSRLAAVELVARRDAADAPDPDPTAGPTDDPTATGTPTDDPTATGTPTDDPTATGTPTDEPTSTGTPTDDPTATATATDGPTSTETATDEETDGPAALDLVVASGRNWPDALGAGAAAAEVGAVFLLADATTMDNSPQTLDFLDAFEDRIGQASVAGGANAVAGAVLSAITPYVSDGDTPTVEPIPWVADPFAGDEPTPSSTGGDGPSDAG